MMRAPVPKVAGFALCVILLAIAGPLSPSQHSVLAASNRTVVHDGSGKVIRGWSGSLPHVKVSVLNHGALEPTIGVTKEAIFYTAGVDNTSGDVLRSTDEGRSWEVVSPRLPNGENAHRLSFDPYLHLDETTGRVFDIDLTVACSYMSFSDDLGESWTTNPLACGTPVNDHQTLFTGPAVTSEPVGYENVVYYCNNGVAGAMCSKSLDGGLTFVPTGDVAFPGTPIDDEQGSAQLCGGLTGHGVVDHEGIIYLPKEHCGEPWLAMSRDEGLTWERIRVSSQPSGPNDPSVAVDEAGNIYFVWTGADRLTYLAYSTDGGTSWSEPLLASAPSLQEVTFATVDAGKPGRVVIGYYGSENSRFQRVCGSDLEGNCRASYAGVTWNGYMTKSTNVLARRPTFTTTQINSPDRYLVYGTCGPRRCPGVWDFMDVEIAPDGSAWGAFVASETKHWGQAEGIGGMGLAAHLDGGVPLK